jgi:hypothetical protein
MMPWASVLWACDDAWWAKNKELWQDFQGLKFTWCKGSAQRFGLRHVRGTNNPGLGKEILHSGGSGGYMAINLAYHLGARWIGLLGFDMQMTGGKTHFFGDHRRTSNPTEGLLKDWVPKFVPLYHDLKSEGVELVNCTRETALTIPRADLDDVLNG